MSGPDAAGLVVACVVVAPAVWAILRPYEGWPYSSYPMFSHGIAPAEVTVFGLAIERQDHALDWWMPRERKLQETLGNEFRNLVLASEREVKSEEIFAARAVTLVLADPPDASGGPPVAVCVVRRSLAPIEGQPRFRIVEEVVRRYALKGATARVRTS